MDMNPHSLLRSHSRSALHNAPHYVSASHANARFPHPRTHMSYSSNHHSHPYQDPSWNSAGMVVPPLLQKVYILDCNSCGSFLTNRGMRAVLLLQPDVSLYSTDALPVNCSVTPGPLEYAPSYESITASSSPSCPSGIPVPVPRTCECLTQTLSCHGCGSSIGYMVVIPCNRCTSSVSPTNRHTNRHRFVFFNKEIVASERRYIPHEPGIISYSPVLVSAMTPSSMPSSSSSLHMPDTSSPHTSQYSLADAQYFNLPDGATSPLSTPPLESPVSMDYHSQTSHTLNAPRNTHYNNFPSFQFVTLKCERIKLRAGDVIYWHNLSSSGEIPAVVEDERARASRHSTQSPFAGR